ncbi:MAG: hypothetical protein JJD98_18970 [Polaromonas sp.]|nr:hypothetical protein [Polaromonas sp.]
MEYKQERAWLMAAEQIASVESGAACKNVSSNGATREVFMDRIGPQLGFNDEAFRKMLIKDVLCSGNQLLR